jgi:S1-C subfamily serine protease
MRATLASLLCIVLTAACAGGVTDVPAGVQARYDSLRPGTIGLAVAASGSDVVVVAVREGSAAQKAGVREGDRITRCNGEPVDSLRGFEQRVLESRPGTFMRLELTRGTEVRAVELPVEEILTAELA